MTTEERELTEALEIARSAPDDEAHWDAVEELAASTQRFEEVAALYRDVLREDLGPRLAAVLGQRAVQFIEEWYGEDAPELVQVLERVLDVDPSATWAFQRLTVVHTAAGRWTQLFALYDSALEAAEDDARRRELLDEAANVAKDFAGDADRAIGYMLQLLPLEPADSTLSSSLERLLEREERFGDLITLWNDRLSRTRKKNKIVEYRRKIAKAYLERLERYEDALAEAGRLIEEGGRGKETEELFERIAASDDAPVEVRRAALRSVRALYDEDDRTDEVVRTLEAALALADQADARVGLRRELGQLELGRGELDSAMEHFAALLSLDPGARDALMRLREIAKRSGAHERFATALEAAADRANDSGPRVSLRVEAADTRRTALSDVEAAIGLYQRVLSEPEAEAPVVLDVARRLGDLLGHADRNEERLGVLMRLAESEPNVADRRAALGQAARVADQLGRTDDALEAWRRRLSEDAADLEALDATIAIVEREERWADLLAALKLRTEAPVPSFRRRADLVHIARVQEDELDRVEDAITTWRRIAEDFEEDSEVVDALAALLAKVERWEDMAEVLGRAAAREGQHVASIYVRIGDVQRRELASASTATRAYADALRIDPRDEIARKGLTALLEDADCLGPASEGLSAAYRATDEWQSLCGLLEHRLAGARTSAERVEILRETARMHEDRGQDLAEALLCMRRAMAIAPDLRDIEGDVFRLAETTGRWDVAVAAIHDAVEVLGEDAPRSRYLRFWEGKVCEQELDRPADALDAYQIVFDGERTKTDAARGIARTAGGLGRWDRAAKTLLLHAEATGAVDTALLEEIEGVVSGGAAWEDFADAFQRALDGMELPRALGRELELLLSRWHHERRNDAVAAQRALARAVERDDSHVPTLERLVLVQRETPGRELFNTLIRLADLAEDNLDPLREATAVALEHLDDAALKRTTTDRLYREAARLWKRHTQTTGAVAPPECTRWALDRLVELYDADGDSGMKVAVLADAAHLPVEPDESRSLRRRAAEVAAASGDRGRAIVLYRGILDEVPEDQVTLAALADVCEAEGRLPEMMALRQHELTLATETSRRLKIRLDLARIVGEMEKRGGRVESLLTNLEEEPGHEASIEALIEVLEPAHRFEELAGTLTVQGKKLEAAGEARAAARWWSKVAELSEHRLSDVERALDAHRRVVELTADAAGSLDALARLHTDWGEHAAAAQWLERRLSLSEGTTRTNIAKQLAEAHLGADQPKRAVAVLEAALEQAPERTDLRDMLAVQYRTRGTLEPLARLLTDAAPYVTDASRLLESAREAAAIYTELGRPDQVIPILERAAEAAPGERDVRVLLASGYRVAGRLDEAKALLTEVVDSYGRRRNSERAHVHQQLAEVYHAQGDLEEALAQLELATKMDVRNPKILGALGSLAYEAGELDRAERAYRALLLIVRRSTDDEKHEVGPSEVLYELHRLAAARDDESQATELLESAFEAATQDDEEAQRLVRTLRRRGESELALEALARRIEEQKDKPKAARLGYEAARLLSDVLDRPDEAVVRALKAAADGPNDAEILDGVREMASKHGQSGRYIETLRGMVKAAGNDEALASSLLLRLGATLAEDVQDFAAARKEYERVELLGHARAEAWRRLAALAGKSGDQTEEVRVLDALIASEDESITDEDRVDAMYRSAEVKLLSGRTGGVEQLRAALERDPQNQRAAELLRDATARDAGDEAMALYERVARAAGEQPLILDFLSKRMQSSDVTLGELREGTELALGREDRDLAQEFLERAVELVEGSEAGLRGALWVPTQLAQVKRAAGDVPGAVAWMQRAAELSDDERAFELRLEAAALATGDDGDLEVAASLYETLLEVDSMDRRIWEPLLDVYRRREDEDRLNDLSAQIIDGLLEPDARNAVRMQKAMYLLEREGREPDAADALRAILDDDPQHTEATALLSKLFERSGYDDDLAELLNRQLDVARDNQDLAQIKELTLKLGTIYEKVRREDALDVYRRGLDWLSRDPDIARALLALLTEDDDPRERIELNERILANETGPAAAARALELAAQWESYDNQDGVQRALELGYGAHPSDDGIRERLESFYQAREQWEPLARFRVAEARRARGDAAVHMFREAAKIYRESLGQLSASADVLAEAGGVAPGDLGILTDLVRTRAEGGEQERALEELEQVLVDIEGTERAPLLRLRAELRQALGDPAGALEDIEAAYRLAPREVGPDLVAVLRDRLGSSPDDRDLVLRLVQVLVDTGADDEARQVLVEWIGRTQDDIEALMMLRRMEEAAERWEEVANVCARLIYVQSGEGQVEAALGLADACARAGRPEAARDGLEQVQRSQPESQALRDRLRALYESIGAHFELAGLLLQDAEASGDAEQRYAFLRAAGDHYLKAGDPDSATGPLYAAVELRPDDHAVTVLLIDSFIAAERFADAGQLLETSIASHTRRRSPELGELQFRMAALARAAGDRNLEMQWLNAALDSDKTNGLVAAGLAQLAMELGEHDIALTALRVVTLNKTEGPMSRAMAFLLQARIAHERGEARRALLWARKARSEDPELAEVDDFLQQIGEA